MKKTNSSVKGLIEILQTLKQDAKVFVFGIDGVVRRVKFVGPCKIKGNNEQTVEGYIIGEENIYKDIDNDIEQAKGKIGMVNTDKDSEGTVVIPASWAVTLMMELQTLHILEDTHLTNELKNHPIFPVRRELHLLIQKKLGELLKDNKDCWRWVEKIMEGISSFKNEDVAQYIKEVFGGFESDTKTESKH